MKWTMTARLCMVPGPRLGRCSFLMSESEQGAKRPCGYSRKSIGLGFWKLFSLKKKKKDNPCHMMKPASCWIRGCLPTQIQWFYDHCQLTRLWLSWKTRPLLMFLVYLIPGVLISCFCVPDLCEVSHWSWYRKEKMHTSSLSSGNYLFCPVVNAQVPTCPNGSTTGVPSCFWGTPLITQHFPDTPADATPELFW